MQNLYANVNNNLYLKSMQICNNSETEHHDNAHNLLYKFFFLIINYFLFIKYRLTHNNLNLI